MQRVTVLGSTGSIGLNTLDVIRSHPDRFELHALTANSQVAVLARQCLEFKPRYAAIRDETLAGQLTRELVHAGSKTIVLSGDDGIIQVAADTDVDVVVAAIVGAAGLQPTMAAVSAGKRVLLANKESLVMAGRLFTDAARHANATILPVDSEHNAIFQCLPGGYGSLREAGVRRILLTGSGGPFRDLPPESLHRVTPDEACAHPNWSMGRKISVDSSTMMNKGLEYIEARWLFGATSDEIEVVIHPQSIVHSMVEYIDGSVVAQMGNPDMRTPIAYCLGWPERIASNVEPLNFFQLGELSFRQPDYRRFPCLKLAMDAMEAGGSYPVALNASNEVAVESFLSGAMAYPHIEKVISDVLESWVSSEPDTLNAVIDADIQARVRARERIASL